jgi:hypothetical protein
MPQAPQFSGSFSRLTHPPPQQTRPTPHDASQLPPPLLDPPLADPPELLLPELALPELLALLPPPLELPAPLPPLPLLAPPPLSVPLPLAPLLLPMPLLLPALPSSPPSPAENDWPPHAAASPTSEATRAHRAFPMMEV